MLARSALCQKAARDNLKGDDEDPRGARTVLAFTRVHDRVPCFVNTHGRGKEGRRLVVGSAQGDTHVRASFRGSRRDVEK